MTHASDVVQIAIQSDPLWQQLVLGAIGPAVIAAVVGWVVTRASRRGEQRKEWRDIRNERFSVLYSNIKSRHRTVYDFLENMTYADLDDDDEVVALMAETDVFERESSLLVDKARADVDGARLFASERLYDELIREVDILAAYRQHCVSWYWETQRLRARNEGRVAVLVTKSGSSLTRSETVVLEEMRRDLGLLERPRPLSDAWVTSVYSSDRKLVKILRRPFMPLLEKRVWKVVGPSLMGQSPIEDD